MNDNINDKVEGQPADTDNMAQTVEADSTAAEGHEGAFPAEEHYAKIEKLEAELAELKDKHIRLIAEFDNARRRSATERIELEKTAARSVVESLLVVLDDMARAEKQLDKTDDVAQIKSGVTLVFNKMRTILASKGLKAMETGKEEFNADLHEAITEIPAPSEDMKGKIIDVVEPGYYLNDKLIRFAKVVVAG